MVIQQEAVSGKIVTMKNLLKILFAPIFWLVNACSPLGDPVDEQKSDNHYYNNQMTDIRYSPMGNWFELGNSPMNADVESFQVLSRYLGKDKNRGYYTKNPIAKGLLDLDTFHAKEGVYLAHIGFDKSAVYYFKQDYGNNQIVEPIVIEGADPDTYEAVDFNWSKDHQNHYYRNQLITVDYQSFQNINEHFSKDAHKVYYHYFNTFKSIDADVGSFAVLDKGYYAKDAHNVYYNHYGASEGETELKRLPIPDGAEVSLLNEAYLQIGDSVYYGDKALDIDVDSLEIVSTYYIKDGSKVYYQDTWLKDADAPSFGLSDKLGITDKNGPFRGAERFQEPTGNQ